MGHQVLSCVLRAPPRERQQAFASLQDCAPTQVLGPIWVGPTAVWQIYIKLLCKPCTATAPVTLGPKVFSGVCCCMICGLQLCATYWDYICSTWAPIRELSAWLTINIIMISCCHWHSTASSRTCHDGSVVLASCSRQLFTNKRHCFWQSRHSTGTQLACLLVMHTLRALADSPVADALRAW